MLLTFIIFQATVSTYFLSVLQTEEIREEGWFGKKKFGRAHYQCA